MLFIQNVAKFIVTTPKQFKFNSRTLRSSGKHATQSDAIQTKSNAVAILNLDKERLQNLNKPLQKRNLHSNNNNNNTNNNKNNKNNNLKRLKCRKLPDLIYVPHILRWLKTKIKFKFLQRSWDPEFSEGAFIYGSTKAVCRITEIINDNVPHELEGLVTKSTELKLRESMKIRLTKTQRDIIRLRPDDIKILVPISVSLDEDHMNKECKIKLRILALKWHEHQKHLLRLVLVALQTEFLRNYSDPSKGEWTINDFDILECSMLTETPAPPSA